MENIDEIKSEYSTLSKDELIDKVIELKEKVEMLKNFAFSSRSDKVLKEAEDTVGQKLLFNEAELDSDTTSKCEEDDQGKEVNGYIRKNRGKRAPLPKHLERERIEHDLSEDQKKCNHHGTDLKRIGEKVTEKLEIVPAKLKVVEHVTFSYKCPACSNENLSDEIVKSNPEQSLIPKSFATPSLLAYIATSKYQDGLPLYRQEQAFSRLNIDLNRTTMARWMVNCGNEVQPLINLCREDLLSRNVVGCDETRLQVLNEPNRNAAQLSYMWVTLTLEGSPIVIFNYETGRSAKIAQELFHDYSGVVVCDGLKSYESLSSESIQIAGCMAHVRRKFTQADKILKKAAPKITPKTREPLAIIKSLYTIERELKDEPPDKRLMIRQEKSAPLMEQLSSWLVTKKRQVLPKSALGKAISYALNQWDKLLLFLSNPLVPIDNNACERAQRPFVIGRKAWLFSATPKGAEASANLYSLVESAKANGIEPFDYLMLIFKELPLMKTSDEYRKLLPHEVKKFYKLKSYCAPDKKLH